jgi:hypothetical protein
MGWVVNLAWLRASEGSIRSKGFRTRFRLNDLKSSAAQAGTALVAFNDDLMWKF